MESTDQKAINRTKRWLAEFVIGRHLCPFAARPFREDRIAYRSLTSRSPAAVADEVVVECRRLLAAGESGFPETTLLILPDLWQDFADYLDLVDVLNDLLDRAGWRGRIQLATFHPDYVFGDAPAEDPANYTNRSPYPMLHLIREDLLAKALQHYPHPERIPERNVALLREKNNAYWQHLLDHLQQHD